MELWIIILLITVFNSITLGIIGYFIYRYYKNQPSIVQPQLQQMPSQQRPTQRKRSRSSPSAHSSMPGSSHHISNRNHPTLQSLKSPYPTPPMPPPIIYDDEEDEDWLDDEDWDDLDDKDEDEMILKPIQHLVQGSIEGEDEIDWNSISGNINGNKYYQDQIPKYQKEYSTPKLFGDYTVNGVLKVGGFGKIYYGNDDSGKPVILKRPVYKKEDEFKKKGFSDREIHRMMKRDKNTSDEMFSREIRFMKTFSKKRWKEFVEFYDCFEDNGKKYLVMEYIKGDTLADYVKKKENLSNEEIIEIMESICSALENIHMINLVHRDLKPENLMVSVNNKIRWFDFGSIKEYNPSGHGTRIYTAGWAPPEQQEGTPVKYHLDIYPLGLILYFLLTGGINPTGIDYDSYNPQDMYDVMDCELEEVHPKFKKIIKKATMINYSQRYQNATEFKEALLRKDEKEITCSVCGEKNPFFHPQCSGCGHVFDRCPNCFIPILKPDVELCTNCNEPLRKCPNPECGEMLTSVDSDHCMACGKKIKACPQCATKIACVPQICPNCDTRLNRCPYCRDIIEANVVCCTSCNRDIRICSNCLAMMRSDKTFCRKCGTKNHSCSCGHGIPITPDRKDKGITFCSSCGLKYHICSKSPKKENDIIIVRNGKKFCIFCGQSLL